MLQHLGGTNKGSCKNYGYRELSYSKNSYYITSGNSGSKYNNNERCYWAFYAPGQRTMYIRLRQMEVIFLWIFSPGNCLEHSAFSDLEWWRLLPSFCRNRIWRLLLVVFSHYSHSSMGLVHRYWISFLILAQWWTLWSKARVYCQCLYSR